MKKSRASLFEKKPFAEMQTAFDIIFFCTKILLYRKCCFRLSFQFWLYFYGHPVKFIFEECYGDIFVVIGVCKVVNSYIGSRKVACT